MLAPGDRPMTRFLAVDNLAKAFGSVRAVDGCSLEVREGTITPGLPARHLPHVPDPS